MSILFKEIEEETPSLQVSAADANGMRIITGRLVLDGSSTFAELEVRNRIDANATPEGWFHLSLVSSDGQPILLYNAIVVSFAKTSSATFPWRYKVFPNTIVLGEANYDQDYHISQISFRLDRLKYFFQYKNVEWQHITDFKDELKAFLSNQRNGVAHKDASTKSGRTYDFTDPDEIYVVHSPPPPLKVSADGIDYSISFGVSRLSMGISSAHIDSDAMITMSFEQSHDINQAMRKTLPISRFFNQLALEGLHFMGAVVSGKEQSQTGLGKVYLPDAPRPKVTSDRHYGFQSYQALFARWSDRKKLSSLMQSWLSLNSSAERRRFREFVDLVIRTRTTTSLYHHLTTLCAAIDCLPELNTSSKVDNIKLRAIADAAHLAAANKGLNLPVQRIIGLFGSIGSPTLKDRIKELFSHVAPETAEAIVNEFCKHVQRLRRISAHGNPSQDLRQPLLDPICTGLLCLCVLFDLKQAGFDEEKLDGHFEFPPKVGLREALEEIGRHCTERESISS